MYLGLMLYRVFGGSGGSFLANKRVGQFFMFIKAIPLCVGTIFMFTEDDTNSWWRCFFSFSMIPSNMGLASCTLQKLAF